MPILCNVAEHILSVTFTCPICAYGHKAHGQVQEWSIRVVKMICSACEPCCAI